MERLCIVVAEHKKFGYICLPYIVETSNQPCYNLVELATIEMAKNSRFHMNETEMRIVEELSNLTDKALCKRFSKGKTVIDFIDKIAPDVIEKLITPYIDKITSRVLPLIIENNILMFNRISGYANLYENDIITFEKGLTRPKFFFTLDETNTLRYSLSINIKRATEIIEKPLIGQKIIEVMQSPATLLLKNTLYCFNDIDTKKFRPFYTKKFIAISPDKVEWYMEKYVKKCISDHYVVAKGFGIRKNNIDCQPILSIDNNIMGAYFSLSFAYGTDRYQLGDKSKKVELVCEDGKYTFYTYQRHTSEEYKYAETLNDMGLKNISNNLFSIGDNKHTNQYQLIEWINKNKEGLDNEHFTIDIKTETESYYDGNVNLHIETQESLDWFDLNAIVYLDGFTIPFIKLKNNIIHKNPCYKLPDGRIFILPEEWFTSWSDIMNFAIDNNGTMRIDSRHKTLLPSDYTESDELGNNESIKMSDTPLQYQVEATLRPYQHDGVRWLNTLYENNKGGILADDMGLGKTLQTIALLSHIYATAPKRKDAETDLFNTYNDTQLGASLIVVPVSLVHNWNNEISKFAPNFKVYNYLGSNRAKSTQVNKIFQHYHIVITTYGLLRNDIKFLSAAHYGYLILDESQKIKNPTSITYRAVNEIKADHYLTISGTPIENNLTDLWAQMNIVNKGLLGSALFFRNFFVQPIENNNEDAEEKLRRLIEPYILRRTKDSVAQDLPPITEQTIYCTMTPEQAHIYEEEKSGCRTELLNMVSSDIKRETFFALKALTRLRLIANHPQLVRPEFDGLSGKTEQVIEQINNIVAEGHKILIFSSFVKDLELIKNNIERQGLKYCMLTGQTTKRESVINEFQNNDDIQLFLISLKAGGVGLNLTKADYVIMLNPWWNPQAEKQAIDRAHRIGQTKHVMVYRFITKDTIEEKIERLQENKRQLASAFITTNNPLTDMTSEEIKALITE